MIITAAADRISNTLDIMKKELGESAFDEWALVANTPSGWKLLFYHGNRRDRFASEFGSDLAALKDTFNPAKSYVGDSAFSHDGHGSGFDAHMCIGVGLFVLFNNTEKNTSEITCNPKWTRAQIPFAELLEAFIADPATA